MRTLALALICLLGFGLGDKATPEAQDAKEVLSNLLLAARARSRAPATYTPATKAKKFKSSAGTNEMKFDVASLGGLTQPGANFFGFANIDPYELGYFDPSGFTVGASENKIRSYREAELKHGRIAMLAALGFFVGETYHPLFDGEIDGASVYALQKAWEMNQGVALFPALLIIGLECISAVAIFRNSKDPTKNFELTDEYLPGDVLAPIGYTFDPLGLKPKDPEAFLEMQTKELNNGRVAMLAVLIFFIQEALSGEPIFR